MDKVLDALFGDSYLIGDIPEDNTDLDIYDLDNRYEDYLNEDEDFDGFYIRGYVFNGGEQITYNIGLSLMRNKYDGWVISVEELELDDQNEIFRYIIYENDDSDFKSQWDKAINLLIQGKLGDFRPFTKITDELDDRY